MDIKYDLKASYAARGVALLMLLWHHLFYMRGGQYCSLVLLTSDFAKVCVAIFILLSGYGLAISVQDKPIGLMSFYKKRLPALYINYWLIALIFIPIGIIFGYRPLEYVFQTSPYLKLLLQMTGFHMFMDSVGFGYNPTWWFMSLILALYLLFPLMHYLLKKFGLWFLFACFFLNFPPQETTKWFNYLFIWVFTFCLGMYLARTNGLAKASQMLKRVGAFRYVILGAGILISFFIREVVAGVANLNFLVCNGFDWVYGFVIVLLTFEITQEWRNCERVLVFLGRHLFNIFLFHTFILLYWPEFIYGFKYPLLIFMALLAVSIIISMAIELIKKFLGIKTLLTRIDEIKVSDRLFISS